VAELLSHVGAFAASANEDARVGPAKVMEAELALALRLSFAFSADLVNALPRLRK
jgi:hypothetical protein